MSARIFHVDLDAFFASVEQLDDPSLKGKPVIVGARPGGRGVVSTCSYEARAFGVHSAMPISEAWRRCPHAAFLPPRMDRYSAISGSIMSIFEDFTPDVRRVSVDEAFLDMGGTERLWGRPEEAAASLKRRVRDECGLGLSIGCASNQYVAKIASGLRKPDGLVIVPEGDEAAFMRELPLGKLWGAGEKTQDRFRELGIFSVAQLAALGERQLRSLFGDAGGRFLWQASRGHDPGMFSDGPGSRSMSAETTFERDVSDRQILESVLLGMADDLAHRLWAEGLSSRCLTLKLRYHDFTTISRRRTRTKPMATASEAWKEACALLESVWNGSPEIRLIGLGFADLGVDHAGQGELFESGDERRLRAERAVFDLARRGIGKVTRARLVGKDRHGAVSPKGEGTESPPPE